VKYVIFKKEGDKLLDRLVDPEGKVDPLEFDSYEETLVWLSEAARKEKIPSDLDGYAAKVIDKDGNILEEVPEQDAELAGADANLLLKEDPEVLAAVSTLIASRQLYGFAVLELEKILDAKESTPHPMTMDVFIQTAANSAGEFEPTELFEGIVETIIPWMQKAIGERTEEEAERIKEERKGAEEQRRKSKVPMAVPLSRGEPLVMGRKQTVIFVGYAPAVKIILDHIANAALLAKVDDHPDGHCTIVRLTEKARPEDQMPRLLRFGLNVWENCTHSKKKWPRIVDQQIAPMLSTMPDMLICDDLTKAYGGALSLRDSTCATSAVKRFREWCSNQSYCALVGGVPMDTEEPPAFGKDWHTLQANAILRPLTIVREADDLKKGEARIVVGRDAFQMDVDAKMLQAESKIILP
jgi:hypothetical protein